MNKLIKIEYESDRPTVSARELHKALQIKTKFHDWFKRMCTYGFIEGIHYYPILSNRSDGKAGKPKTDYQLTVEMGKHICTVQKNEMGYKFREYLFKCEQSYRDLLFRQGDKKHQLECMELLQHLLPAELKHEKLSYIKANTVVNKVVSTVFGFPKMLKKYQMNPDMLAARENVLNDYIKLFEVLNDNSLVRDALIKKYQKVGLTLIKT